MNRRDPLAPNTHRDRGEDWTKPEPSGPSPALIALWVFIAVLIVLALFLEWVL